MRVPACILLAGLAGCATGRPPESAPPSLLGRAVARAAYHVGDPKAEAAQAARGEVTPFLLFGRPEALEGDARNPAVDQPDSQPAK